MDALDRRIAAALQLNGRATWRDVARVVDSSESTVARRGRLLLEAGLVRVTGQPDPARVGLGYPVLVQLECAPGDRKAVARTLARRPDVRFLTIVTGGFDIVLELIVESRRHLSRVLLDELSAVDGITATTTEWVLRTFKTSYDWSRELLGDQRPVDPAFGSELRAGGTDLPDPWPLDATDLRLIQLLGDDGRRTYAELAAALGTSESMVRRRFAALVAHGYLVIATLVDPHVIDYEVEALVWLQVRLGEVEAVGDALAAHREVRYLAATSGFSDLVCEIVLRSPPDLYAFWTEKLGALEGIQRASIAHELGAVKRGYVEMNPVVWDDDATQPSQRADGRRS